VTNFGRLLDRGVPAQLYMHKEEPVHPDRFWGIENLTQSDSHAIYDSLAAAGFLVAEDYLIPEAFDDIDSDGKADWTDAVPEYYEALMADIADLLEASFAGHNFFSNANKRVLDFFDNPVALVDLVPVIDDVSPTSGVEGRVVTITGSNLVGIHWVKFNGVEAQFEMSKETTLYAIVPPGASSGTIVVSNDAGDADSPMVFEVPATPNIDAFEPTEGPVGTEVTITGTGFTGTSIVRLGTIDATFVVDSDAQIRFVVSAGSVSSKFGLSAPGGIAISEDGFRVR
jgi:hypothetical protein